MKNIGIIGGMGPLATAHLFERIILKTEAVKDQEHIRVVIDSNTNIPDRTRAIIDGGEDPVPEMLKSAKYLRSIGADFLIMPCNTAHYFIDKLKSQVDIPFINMLEETVKSTYLRFGSSVTVGLLATDGTIKSGIYKQYYDSVGIRMIIPDKTQTKVMSFIYDVIKAGKFAEGTDLMFDAVDELKRMGADAFLLGCTELSSADFMYGFEGNFINPIDILAEQSILFAGGKIKNE